MFNCLIEQCPTVISNEMVVCLCLVYQFIVYYFKAYGEHITHKSINSSSKLKMLQTHESSVLS